jgi:hypothetical protein
MWRITGYSSDDAVAAQHVACLARDIQRLAAGVALDQGDQLRGDLARAHELAGAQAALQAEGDLGLHVGELELDDLVCGQGTAELLRSSVYLRAACQQASAAPMAPQAMP